MNSIMLIVLCWVGKKATIVLFAVVTIIKTTLALIQLQAESLASIFAKITIV
jgi:hypothetical protein